MFAASGTWRSRNSIQLVRDRLMTGFLLLFPVVQLACWPRRRGKGCGICRWRWWIWIGRLPSRACVQALDNIPELDWRYQAADLIELTALIDEGQAAIAGVVIPPGYRGCVGRRGRARAVQIIVDGSNTAAAATAQAAVEGVLNDLIRRGWPRQRASPQPRRCSLRTEVRYNPALNSRLFTIPAQMGFIVYQVTLAVASLVFARERELGTLEQLLVTPLRRFELMTGKAALAWLVGGLDFLLCSWW